jgi:alpha-tubulin suppressor-like RCC1 family protein
MRLTFLLEYCALFVAAVACSGGSNGHRTALGSGGAPTNGGASSEAGSNTSGGDTGSSGGDTSPGGGDTSATGGAPSVDASIDGSTSDSSAPDAVKSITAGFSHVCAVLNDGSIQCWGNDYHGELGDAPATDCCNAKNKCICNSTPLKVTGITNAVAATAGSNHACAVLSDSSLQCWGYNVDGQLGNSSTADSPSPVTVPNVTDVIAVAGGAAHTCALLNDGSIQCWGYNYQGELGNGTMSTYNLAPVAVVGISDAVVITAGELHTCALLKSGSVKCWGDNTYAQLGDGTTTKSSVPRPVVGVSNAVAIGGGYGHMCAALSDGAVQCWGYNSRRQLGNPNVTSFTVPVPVTVTGVSNATAVAVGRFHSCAALRDGKVQCWGGNDWGQVGNGDTQAGSGNEVLVPVAATVSGITDAIDVKLGDYYACALLSSGVVQCWGDGSSGQLGNGITTGISAVPVTVIGL